MENENFDYDAWLADITEELADRAHTEENNGYLEFGEYSSAHSKRSRQAMRDYESY